MQNSNRKMAADRLLVSQIGYQNLKYAGLRQCEKPDNCTVVNIPDKAAFLFFATIAAVAFTSNPALAHRFNVAHVIPLSTAASVQAAQGYNAARRIDAAVRAQGGVGDIVSLRRTFTQTARGFDW